MHRLWPWLVVLLLVAATIATSDARILKLLATTGVVAGSTAVLATAVGTFLAVAFLKTNLPRRSAGPWLLGGLLFLPLYIHIAGWETVLGKFGWWTTVAGKLDAPLLTGYAATIWIHTVASLPWVVLFVAAGLASVDPAWEEAAACDLPWSGVLWRVTLPAVLPFVALAALWVGITTAGEMTVTNIYQVRTYAEEVYTNLSQRATLSETLRGALPGMLGLSACVLTVLLLLRGIVPATAIDGRTSRSYGPQRPWLTAAAAWFIVILVVAVPLASLVHQAGVVVTETEGRFVRRWSAAKAAAIVARAPADHWAEGQSTLVIALSAAVVTVLVAVWPAWQAAKRRSLICPGLMLLPALIPGPLVNIAVILLLNRPEDPTGLLTRLYDDSLVPPILAVLTRTIPIAGLILWSSFRQTPRNLRDLAALEASSTWRQGWLLIGGLHLRALIAAFLAAAAVAAGDLACSILVLPPGVQTVAFRVFQLLHSGCDDRMAALCMVQFTATACLGGIVAWLMRSAVVSKTKL